MAGSCEKDSMHFTQKIETNGRFILASVEVSNLSSDTIFLEVPSIYRNDSLTFPYFTWKDLKTNPYIMYFSGCHYDPEHKVMLHSEYYYKAIPPKTSTTIKFAFNKKTKRKLTALLIVFRYSFNKEDFLALDSYSKIEDFIHLLRF